MDTFGDTIATVPCIKLDRPRCPGRLVHVSKRKQALRASAVGKRYMPSFPRLNGFPLAAGRLTAAKANDDLL